MRKKLLNYMAMALVVIAVALVGKIGNRDGAALATITSYADHTAIPPDTLRLLKTVNFYPDNLLKVTAQDVRVLLNEPELVREEPPTRVWQYRTDSCVLDIYFRSMDPDDNRAQVKHYEIRARDSAAADNTTRQACIRALISRRNSPRMVDVSAIYKGRD